MSTSRDFCWVPWLSVLLICCVWAQSLHAHFPRPGAPSRAERALKARGYELDTPSLFELVRTGSDLEARLDAISVLSHRPAEEVLVPIRALFETESNALIHRELAFALASFGESSAFEILHLAMWGSELEEEQVQLASRLARLGDLTGYSVLRAGLESSNWRIRGQARDALIYLPSEHEALDPSIDRNALVLAGLRDPEAYNRRSALSLARRDSDVGTVPEVLLAVIEQMAEKDPAPDVRERAEQVLRLHERSKDPRLRQLKIRLLELKQEQLRQQREDPPPPENLP